MSENKSLTELFDSIIELQKTNPEALEQFIKSEIEYEIERISDGNEDKRIKLQQFQWGINKELRKYKNPVARMNKMAELFWVGVKKFENSLKGTIDES